MTIIQKQIIKQFQDFFSWLYNFTEQLIEARKIKTKSEKGDY